MTTSFTTRDTAEAKQMGISLGCEMCALNRVREANLRDQIAEAENEIKHRDAVIAHLQRRINHLYLGLFGMGLAVAYFAVRG